MELQRRTWLKSRGVWAGTVYLIFAWLLGKYVAPRTEALWPWAWPWSGYIVFGLLMLAGLVLVGIMLYVFVYYMAGPALTSIVEKELDKRTAKAKEKYADGLMSLNTAICSATFIAVLLFPLTAFIQSISNMTNPVVQMPWVLRISGMWEALLFDAAPSPCSRLFVWRRGFEDGRSPSMMRSPHLHLREPRQVRELLSGPAPPAPSHEVTPKPRDAPP